MADSSICPICKCPRKEGDSGSLTQWIVVCNCNAIEPEEAKSLKVNLCRSCGKRIGEGRAGSFTQYIFRSDLCRCESPHPYEVEAASVETLEPATVAREMQNLEELDEAEDLELEEDKFPYERYRPIRQLGFGGGGSVYLARDRLLNKLVAVKLIRYLEDKSVIAFQEEARATSKLNHPGIVSLMDFGVTAASMPYMVLEYVPGLSLEDLISQEGRLDWTRCQEIFVGVMDALIHAHENGLLHRDVKPGNIIILNNGIGTGVAEVKLIDFGIAKLAEVAKETNSTKEDCDQEAIVGAPLYMSPEQGKGLEYDARSEVYALGCVLFHALTGSPPFVGENALQTLAMHVESEPPRLSEIVDGVPKDIEKLLLKAMAKSPVDRYHSMAEFKEHLQSIEIEEVRAETVDTKSDTSQKVSGTRRSAYILLPLAIIFGAALILYFIANKTDFSQLAKGSFQNEEVETEIAPGQKYEKDRGFLTSIPEEVIDKELGWTGGKWEYVDNPNFDQVTLKGHCVTDEDFKGLDKGPFFNAIELTMESSATGSGLRYILNSKIKHFTCMSLKFNDEGAKYLSQFPDIGIIQIYTANQLTEKGLADIAKLPALHKFALRKPFRLPKGGVEALSHSKSLREISFDYITPFTRDDLECFTRLPKLKVLLLNGMPDVDDSYIPILQKMNLRELEIGMTKISDKGLEQISTIESLHRICLSVKSQAEVDQIKRKLGTDNPPAISEAGFLRFQTKRPDCKWKLYGALNEAELF